MPQKGKRRLLQQSPAHTWLAGNRTTTLCQSRSRLSALRHRQVGPSALLQSIRLFWKNPGSGWSCWRSWRPHKPVMPSLTPPPPVPTAAQNNHECSVGGGGVTHIHLLCDEKQGTLQSSWPTEFISKEMKEDKEAPPTLEHEILRFFRIRTLFLKVKTSLVEFTSMWNHADPSIKPKITILFPFGSWSPTPTVFWSVVRAFPVLF